MDDKDRILLQLLEENCRTPTNELAVLAEVSEQDIRDRIDRLEAAGVIRRYGAVVDWERAGNGNVAAVIELKVSPERDFGYDRIAERIARFPAVRSLRLMTGAYDLQLLVVGSSMHEIARFVAEQIAPMDRIRETATHIIMKTYKENGTTYAGREEVERLPYSF
ncbi:MAG: putative HTH-type transcriptional regulator [Euryarchaeota archaeon ADurb.Bin009]|jgi:DNA-binding Lrp family transcriptional regulator|uniref:Lrp/AsnC family transcriptional regulator n=1 Tax=Methanoculleus sp. TaxID=90427 RepID=UPI0009D462DB|nr:Lrp/AsnC family transcriptional regulator [Methanoculleus sp.]OQC69019.1 MAG: putative HTH-type transcriptional regulator [Euryarchaeota archaeon ADurb.Bin009]MBP7145796.1 Lrp/AsnC family transcriptional regulator [Methanoculleus sp.]HNV38619.1 Lrp/AsnC family transcriptional regulator [Methanoculleus sp.]HOF96954.1 Lrp/AsnC family transcriptional regulator [Methanoculleus sp.]HOI61455.1 Lrp/AsnC family transcriptional regulator [Methanoculleus sp.]